MKRNGIVWLRIVLLAAGIVLVAIECVTYHGWRTHFLCDVTYRHNEIVCAHGGVDPFDIYERKVTSDEFCGLSRPDMPDEPQNGRRVVHSYPAWHMAAFWWYGYLPRNACLAVMIAVNACFLGLACRWISKRLQHPDRLNLTEDVLFLVAMLLFPLCGICQTWNYGLFLLGCMLLLFAALRNKHEILAGVVFSFIMIKPQVGIALLLPLFFGKWYKTVAVAAAICFAETLFIAWKLDKSPVDLILQLPRLGAPYYKGFYSAMASKVFGPAGRYVSMGGFLLIAAAGCFLLRKAEDVWVRFLPAVAIVPLWTYSQHHDWFVVLPCYVFILNCKLKYPRLYLCSFCLALCWIASFFAEYHGFRIHGHTLDDAIFLLALLMSAVFLAVLDANQEWVARSRFRDWSFLRKQDRP